ncbi:MAG TPA: tetratricopeptide repeat protein [Spirochaetota bacterium]|nr:tetratricopeptide repeat protein [Spirochaetota bacterium]
MVRVFVCLSLLSVQSLLVAGMNDARLALRAGRPEEALRLYAECLADGRDDAALWYGLARARFALDQLVLAAAACDAALFRDPSHQGAWALRGRVRVAQHRFPEAVRDLRQALDLRPDDAWVCGELARVLGRQGRLEEGYRYAILAAESLPADAGRMLGAAWAALALGRWQDAESWCLRAERAGAGRDRVASIMPRIQMALADGERRAGRIREAGTRLLRIISDWPATPQAATARMQLAALGRLAGSGKDP